METVCSGRSRQYAVNTVVTVQILVQKGQTHAVRSTQQQYGYMVVGTSLLQKGQTHAVHRMQ